MPLVQVYEIGYRDGFERWSPMAQTAFDPAERALYAMGYREGSEDREHVDDDLATVVL